MKFKRYEKQLLIIGLAISLGLIGLLLVVPFKIRQEKNQQQIKQKIIQQNMFLRSPDFKNNEIIPGKFTCDGLDINPELMIAGVPTEAQSLALLMDDPDSPTGTWTHWLIWNIDPTTEKIERNSIPANAILGKTSFGENKYGGPCPMKGEHHYIFTLYALDAKLDLNEDADKQKFLAAISGHIIDTAELVGLYSR
jgi:hypothetical protein